MRALRWLPLLAAACSSTAYQPHQDAGHPDACSCVDGGDNYYLPAGFTLTPFLSTDAQHSFTGASMVLDPAKAYQAVIESGAGRMTFDLDSQQAPITCNSFIFLALHHFFDGIAFHRVIDGFVAQGGDPNTLQPDMSTWGSGGPGYTFGLEIDPSLHYDSAGVVGMARTSDPNSNGSQFFITLAPAPSLDGQYTIFARLNEGAAALPLIVRGMPPASPTRMTRVYIVERLR
jgi:peptidylprolyl isomerase